MILIKKKSMIGVLSIHKQQVKKTPNHHGTQQYCLLYKKSVGRDCKWKYHCSDNCFGKSSNQASVLDRLVGSLDNRSDEVKYYQKTE